MRPPLSPIARAHARSLPYARKSSPHGVNRHMARSSGSLPAPLLLYLSLSLFLFFLFFLLLLSGDIGAVYVRWPRDKLKAFLSRRPEIQAKLNSALIQQLSRKLVSTMNTYER